MKPQDPGFVYRADIATQRAVRDSSWQAVPALSGASVVANWWGGPGVIWFAAALWLGGRRLRRPAIARAGLRGAEGLAVASAVSGILKGIAGRARPFVTPAEPWHWEFNRGWTNAQFFSMPSGHTTATMAFTVAVLLATRGWDVRARTALITPLAISVAAVAFARLYADQHWLTDILTALVIGALASVVLARIHARGSGSAYDRVMLGPAPESVRNG